MVICIGCFIMLPSARGAMLADMERTRNKKPALDIGGNDRDIRFDRGNLQSYYKKGYRHGQVAIY